VGWVAVTNFCCGYSLTLSARYVHRRPLPTGAGGRETKSSSCSRAQLPSTHVVVDSGRATHQRGSFVSARLRSASAQKQKLMCASSHACCGVCVTRQLAEHPTGCSNASLVSLWVIYSSDAMSCRAYGDAPMLQRPPLIGSRRGGFLARARVCGASPWVLGILLCGTPRTSFEKPERRSRVPTQGNEHRFDLLTTVAQRTVSGESCGTTQARSSVVRGGTSQEIRCAFLWNSRPGLTSEKN
jgi:hypothetical protein